MKKGVRQTRLCKCGCGRPVKENITSDGRFKGYQKFSPECVDKCMQHSWDDERRNKQAEFNRKRCDDLIPIGTRRKQKTSNGKYYWVIKVPNSGRFQYEHRYVMEKKLGRTLSSKEHVHHINEDTLDNSIDNLIVLNQTDHNKTINAKHGFGKSIITKPHKCPVCGFYHSCPEKGEGNAL